MDQNVVVNFVARNASFMTATKQMTTSVLGLESVITKLYKVAVGFGVGTAAAYYGASRSAAEFEKNLHNVNSILGASDTQMADVAEHMLRLSTEIPQSAAELSSGLYQVISSGFVNAAQAETVLEASAKAAVAGLTDTATSAGAVTTVLNAYGLAASDAAHVSDVLFQAVNVGVVTFDQLAQNVGDFIGTARAAGATLEETFAAFSNITIAMGNPARSATALQGIFRALIKPSEDMTAVLHQLGYANGQAALQSEGLDGILRKLSSAVQGDSTAMAKLFQDTEGFQGVMALLSQDSATAAARIAMFTDRAKVAGVTARVMAEQEKSVSVQMDQMKAAAGAVTIDFGQVMLPIISAGTKALTLLAREFIDLPQPMRNFITVGGLLSGTLIGLGGAYMLLRGKIMLARAGMQLIGQLMGVEQVQAAQSLGVKLMQLASQQSLVASSATGLTTKLIAMKTAMMGTVLAAPLVIGILYGLAKAADVATNAMNPQNIDAMTKAMTNFTDTHKFGAEATKKFGEDLRSLDEQIKLIATHQGRRGQLGAEVFTEDGVVTLEAAKKNVDSLDKALAGLVGSGNAQEAAAIFETLREKLLAAGLTENQIKDALDDYTRAQDAASLSNRGAAASTDALAGSQEILDGILNGTASATAKLDKLMKNLTNTQRSLVGAMSGSAGGFDSIVNSIVSARNKVEKAETKAAKAPSLAEHENEIAQALMGEQRAAMRVVAATKALNDLRNYDYAKDIAKSEENLSDAYQATKDAEYQLIQAQHDLDEARKPPSQRSLEEAEIEVQRAIMAQAAAAEATAKAQEKLNEAQDHGTPTELAESQREYTESLFAQKEAAWRVQDAEKALADLRDQPDKAKEIEDKERAVAAAREAVSDANAAAVDAEGDLAKVRVGAEDAPQKIADAELDLKEAVLGVQTATLALAKAQEEKGQEGQATTREQIDLTMVKLDDFETKLKENVKAHENWQTNIATIAEKYGVATAASLAKLGTEGANLVEQLANSTGADAQRMGTDLEKWALYGTEAFNTAVVSNLGKGAENARKFSKATADALAEELGIGIAAAVALLEKYGYTVEGYANSTLKESGGVYHLINPQGKASIGYQAQGTEDHRAQIAPAGAWRVWAEPETGGEAYIPLASSKRGRSTSILANVANRFGYGLQPMAQGGVVEPPNYLDFRNAGVRNHAIAMMSANAAKAMQRWTGGGEFAKGPFSDLIEVGHKIQGMGFDVSENPAFGGVSAVHTPGSYHYKGRAIDVNWRGSGSEKSKLDDLAVWIRTTVRPIEELLWQVPGHFDHLHLAMAQGGILERNNSSQRDRYFEAVTKNDNTHTTHDGITNNFEHGGLLEMRYVEGGLVERDHKSSKRHDRFVYDRSAAVERIVKGGNVATHYAAGGLVERHRQERNSERVVNDQSRQERITERESRDHTRSDLERTQTEREVDRNNNVQLTDHRFILSTHATTDQRTTDRITKGGERTFEQGGLIERGDTVTHFIKGGLVERTSDTRSHSDTGLVSQRHELFSEHHDVASHTEDRSKTDTTHERSHRFIQGSVKRVLRSDSRTIDRNKVTERIVKNQDTYDYAAGGLIERYTDGSTTADHYAEGGLVERRHDLFSEHHDVKSRYVEGGTNTSERSHRFISGTVERVLRSDSRTIDRNGTVERITERGTYHTTHDGSREALVEGGLKTDTRTEGSSSSTSTSDRYVEGGLVDRQHTFEQGGLLEKISKKEVHTYDQGGYLDPGFTLAYNGTGRPERVVTAGGSGPSGGGISFSRGSIQVTVRAEAGVDEGRLAGLVGEKVKSGVRAAVQEIEREMRRN